ncbi:SNAP receptor PEP12 PWA37_003986 [Arxiozyma heterogenica]
MNQSVNEMNNIDDNELNKSKLMSREKLNKDIKLSIQEFQNIQIEYTKIMKSINLKAQEQLNQNVAALRQEEEAVKEGQQKLDFNMVKDNTNDSIFDADHRSKNNQMIIEMDPINNEEFLYQQNLIRERDAEIQNIEQGINELHEIFRDLGTVIQQQGVLVDNIEANIYSAVDNTQKGSKELHKAMLSQKKQSKFCLYLLVSLSLFLLFMILVILS